MKYDKIVEISKERSRQNTETAIRAIEEMLREGEWITTAQLMRKTKLSKAIFYRNKDVILNIFKQRLITLIKINLLPAIILAIFLPIIIYITGSTTNIIDYISIPLFIIVLSIFFSTHYLIIYYLLQPYNKKMQLKSISYMIVSFFTYFISYQLTKITLSPTIFSLLGIIITIIYIILGISLVYKYAPRTFKIKK